MINWGILGAGNIAHRFANSLEHFKDCNLIAISGRNESKLLKFAEQFNVPRIYLDHSQLIEDPKIDCIYIALPHQFHKEWIIKALENNKAVLCEKPSVLNSKDLEEIKKVSKENNVLFMEAMKSRFVPAYLYVKDIINRGLIGELESIKTSFCDILPEENYGKTYHTDTVSRGALYDTGVYCSSLLTDFLGDLEKIESLNFIKEKDIILEVEAQASFSKGKGNLKCSFINQEPRQAEFLGSKGKIILDDFYRATSLTIVIDGKEEQVEIPYKVDDFYSQISHFINLYKSNLIESPIMSIKDSYDSITVLEDIYKKIELT